MKKIVLTGMVLAMAACSQPPEAPKEVKLDTENAKLSYAMGMDVGRSLSQIGGDVEVDAFVEGFKTTLAKGETRMTQEESAKVKQSFFQKRQQEQQAKMEAEGEANKKAGEEFLAANGKREGVTITDSGLQYEVITPAVGPKPAAADTVTVHYKGTLIDGTEFDSSIARGQPATFPLNRVIKGWTEGVQLMSVGSKYRFYIPSDLAYGPRGAGPKIGPNSTLVFEVELISIGEPKPAEQPKAAEPKAEETKPAEQPAAE